MIVNPNIICSKYKPIINNDQGQVRIMKDVNKSGYVKSFQQRNTLSINQSQFPIQIMQNNQNIQMDNSLILNNRSFENHINCYAPTVFSKNIDVKKQQQYEFPQQKQSTSQSMILDKQQELSEKNEETVKKTRHLSFSGDSQTSNIKPLQLNIKNIYSIDSFSTTKGGDQSGKAQTGSLSFQLTNQSFDSQLINLDSQNYNNIKLKNINSSEKIDQQNKDISQKVILLIQEIEKLQIVNEENQKQNRILQDQVDFLQRDRLILQESLMEVQENSFQFQQNQEQNNKIRQGVYNTNDSIQNQLQSAQKEKDEAQLKYFDLEIKIEQVIQENEKILSINESLVEKKQNLEEEIKQKEVNLSIYRAQIEDITKELRSKNEIIKQKENEKILWSKQLKQIEIMQQQQNIDTENFGTKLFELQNSNEQLLKKNKDQQDTIEKLTFQYEGALNENKKLQTQHGNKQEQSGENEQNLSNQISQLQNENIEYQQKCQSLTNKNDQLNKQIIELQTNVKNITLNMNNLQDFINKNQYNQTQHINSVQKEEQKVQQLQMEIQELAKINNQLQLNIKEYQSRYQEQILKQSQLEYTIQQQKQLIYNQSEQFKENQSMYSNVIKNSQNIHTTNEDQLKQSETKRLIEQLKKDKFELINKINLLLSENENVLLANENLEKQLKSKVEDIDIKKKLLLNLQKENETFFRSQIINTPQSYKSDYQIECTQNQNQQLQQSLQEKEQEVNNLNKELSTVSKEKEEIRIKLIQYQQKENIQNQDNQVQQNTNNFKNQISLLKIANEKLSNENQQLFDLLKLRKQEIIILQDKLDKKQSNTIYSNNNHTHFNTSSKDQ